MIDSSGRVNGVAYLSLCPRSRMPSRSTARISNQLL
jgi:hypothetical protein